MPSSDEFMSFPDHGSLLSTSSDDQPWIHARMLSFGAVTLRDHWVDDYMCDVHWRLYCNLDEGCVVETDAGDYRMHKNHIYVMPAW